MSKVSIKQNAVRNISTAGRWLSIINASSSFVIDVVNVGTVVGAVGRQYDLGTISEVNFINDTEQQLDVEYEVANIRITSTAGDNVKVTNALTIAAVQDTLNVRSENVSATGLNTLDDVVLNAGERVQLVSTNTLRHELLVKNTSANNSVVRIGGAQCDSQNGLEVVKGGTLSLNSAAAVYAYNTDTDKQAKLSVMEILQ
ncbi:hypothetical protein [Pseudoalteromonas aurantia]|uniref:Auto-transporter adhesin head GIN domain-containing protein n=1 Tax=Pseudoalteromonas aurantia TaxID=43654 RepID=A0ABY2VYX2_9GAMM|nr:hypothetical protein [Pseudoalteromonas aurantia]TMO75331.1 hypothetical protein CWC20_08395 [Pseudoalteromonas aurantia]